MPYPQRFCHEASSHFGLLTRADFLIIPLVIYCWRFDDMTTHLKIDSNCLDCLHTCILHLYTVLHICYHTYIHPNHMHTRDTLIVCVVTLHCLFNSAHVKNTCWQQLELQFHNRVVYVFILKMVLHGWFNRTLSTAQTWLEQRWFHRTGSWHSVRTCCCRSLRQIHRPGRSSLGRVCCSQRL